MKKECPTCGGTGQTGYFQGVSRFLITWEECLQCFGTGEIDATDEAPGHKENNECGRPKGAGKKKR